MAKTRLSISLDEEQAERIRAYAERAGMDLSSYLVNGAVLQMNMVDEAEAQFAHVDAMTAQAVAAEYAATPAVDDADLTPQEQAAVQAVHESLFGPHEPEHEDNRHVA